MYFCFNVPEEEHGIDGQHKQKGSGLALEGEGARVMETREDSRLFRGNSIPIPPHSQEDFK